jgi:hypothetical protein
MAEHPRLGKMRTRRPGARIGQPCIVALLVLVIEDGDVAVQLWMRELRIRCEIQFVLTAEYGCQRRGRFTSGGLEIYYWNPIVGVRVLVSYRDPFTVDLCPIPEGTFPPGPHEYGARQRIEWYDAFDVVRLVTGRRPRFTDRQLYGNDPVVITAYADALRGPCRSLLRGDTAMWARLRRQRAARIAYWRRRAIGGGAHGRPVSEPTHPLIGK